MRGLPSAAEPGADTPGGTVPPILCVGAASWDIVLGVDAFPAQPTKVLATRCVETSAGMASAAAMSIAALGGRAAVLARIGDDGHGDRWLAGIEAAGVETSLVERIPGAPTALSAIVVDARGERLIVPHYDTRLWRDGPRVGDEALAHFGAFLVDTRWPDASERILRHARASGRPVLLDADVAPPDIIHRLLPLASHVVFSAEALGAACPDAGPDVGERLRAAACMTDAELGVTLGAEGCVLYRPQGIVRLAAPAVRVVDTLAAGDVFHGAFLLGLVEGRDPEAAAAFANAAAALKCTRFGGAAGRPDRAEVDALLAATGGTNRSPG